MKATEVILIGNAHIDPVWLWRWQEGFAEIKATFRSALDRMDEYPGFVFTSACAAYYRWVEENEPVMFKEIRTRVAEGRWRIAGGMWVQPDCNIPSGESFARHFLYSQAYFKEKFGRAASVGYNADSFGHNGSLPKLLKSAGIDCYVMMRPGPHENPALPDSAFIWESNDGSRVYAYRIPGAYNSPGASDEAFDETPHIIKMRELIAKARADGQPAMYFYGVGNHGGGPTVYALEMFEKFKALPEGRAIIYGGPDDYFNHIRGAENLPVVTGDLQHHASGCYSAHSEIKRNNRRAENRLLSAEALSVMAGVTAGHEYPAQEIDRAWQNVLFNQFHDIICGCSIPEAYEDARELHGEALSIAARTLNAAAQRISWNIDTTFGEAGKIIRTKETDWSFWGVGTGEYELGTPVVVFNPLAWEREIPVELSRPAVSVADADNVPVASQLIRASRTNAGDKYNALFIANVPAFGWRTYRAFLQKNIFGAEQKNPFTRGKYFIENDDLRLSVDGTTGAVRLYDKRNAREVLGENAGGALVVDISGCDTWAHGVFSFREEAGRFKLKHVELLEEEPVRAVLRITSEYGGSVLRQDFTLYARAAEVVVEVKLDWREQQKMLKLCWPVNVSSGAPTYGIPFGHITKSADGLEEAGQAWFDLTGVADGGETYGLAITNDGKYGFDVLGNEMRMTVANSSAYADHYSGEHFDGLCEYLDQGIQFFKYALLPHRGGWEESGVVKSAAELNTEEIHVTETYHGGPLGTVYEGIKLSAGSIAVSALKPALAGCGTVLRAYESAGTKTECEFDAPLLGVRFTAAFTANQIKTFLIENGGVKEVGLCET